MIEKVLRVTNALDNKFLQHEVQLGLALLTRQRTIEMRPDKEEYRIENSEALKHRVRLLTSRRDSGLFMS